MEAGYQESASDLGRHRNGLTAVKEFRDKAGPQDSPHYKSGWSWAHEKQAKLHTICPGKCSEVP